MLPGCRVNGKSQAQPLGQIPVAFYGPAVARAIIRSVRRRLPGLAAIGIRAVSILAIRRELLQGLWGTLLAGTAGLRDLPYFPITLLPDMGIIPGEEEAAMTTKTVDARGRLTLGPRYANRLVIVREHRDGALEIIPAEAVPAREAWLYKNAEAREAVRTGIEEARAGRFAKAPDLKAGSKDDEDDR